MRTDKNNFAPTLGFSWDPLGNGDTTVSGSYGISYDSSAMTVYAALSAENYGASTVVTLTPFTRLSDPALYGSIMPIQTPALFADLGNTRDSRAYVADPNLSTPYTQSWSLRVARQIGTTWKIEAAYVGNHAVGLWRGQNLNQVEMRSNGFLDAFRIAQRNLAQNGNPTRGDSLDNLTALFNLVPSSQYNTITTGQAAALANFLDTTTLNTGVRGGLIEAAGLPSTFFRFNPQVTNLNIVGNRTHSTWNGLKIAITRRLHGGLHIQTNYTMGKGLTDYIPVQTLFGDYRDNANSRLDKALQTYDSTHSLRVNWIYEIPVGSGRRFLADSSGLLDGLVGGWQLNGIETWVTGRPLDVSTGRFTVSQVVSATPNFTGERFHLSKVNKSGDQITTMTAEQRAQFSNPGPGEPGDLPPLSLRGPGYTNLDVSLFKKFRLGFIGESGEAQFRVELFNALNQVSFNSPSVNINNGSFGVISSARSARVGQLALKIVF